MTVKGAIIQKACVEYVQKCWYAVTVSNAEHYSQRHMT